MQSATAPLSVKNVDLVNVEDDKPPGVGNLSWLSQEASLNVSSFVDHQGIILKLNDKTIRLSYPEKIWADYPSGNKKILADNIAFCSTFYLPYRVQQLKRINYRMPTPVSDPFLFKGFSYSLPSVALLENGQSRQSTVDLLRRLFEIDYVFNNRESSLPKVRPVSDQQKAVVPFSFGKDSLLTLSLCRELNLTVYPVYIVEPTYRFEFELKRKLAEVFYAELGIEVHFLINSFGVFRKQDGYMGWELQLTQYSLLLLPFVCSTNSAFILFANEQSCNDTVTDLWGFRYNPVYEQSHAWLRQNSLLASLVGGNSLSIGSIIEPVYELAIIKILHHRYPTLAKYQMSCDPEDTDQPRLGNKRWCENCSKCARIFIFLLAHAINPKNVGFESMLLEEKHASLYPIFEIDSTKSYGYDQSNAGKDEQLLAFLLAYKQGSKGQLMDRFERQYLKETEKRETKLRKKFFGVHSTSTVPSKYRQRILNIFHEELDQLVR